MSASKDRKIVEMHAKIDALRQDLAAARAEIAEHDRWREQFDAALKSTQDDLAAARRLLREVEWDINGKCPICTGWKMPEGELRGRHTDNCPLQATLNTETRINNLPYPKSKE